MSLGTQPINFPFESIQVNIDMKALWSVQILDDVPSQWGC